MIAAPDLVAAKLMYTAGGNSKISGGRTRAVRGFSLGAERRSASSEISNPASTCHVARASSSHRARGPFELLAKPSVVLCSVHVDHFERDIGDYLREEELGRVAHNSRDPGPGHVKYTRGVDCMPYGLWGKKYGTAFIYLT